MLFKKYAKCLLYISFIFLLSECKSGEVHESKKIGKETDKSGIISNNLSHNYSIYNKLDGDFIVKGKVSGNAFAYSGIISVENTKDPISYKLTLVIRDAIFLSPLLSINIINDELKWKDHLNNRENVYTYSNSSILFLFDQKLPTDILIPLITGNLPVEMLKSEKPVSGKSSITYLKYNYEIVGFFNDSILNTLVCNPGEDFHQIVYKMSGKMKNNLSRYFPENIKILFDKNDFIEINYIKIDIK
jgi:hypothetical protein